MIRLEVEPYCQDCRRFSPVAIPHEAMTLGEVGKVQISVKCENTVLCAGLYEYLQGKIPKGEKRNV